MSFNDLLNIGRMQGFAGLSLFAVLHNVLTLYKNGQKDNGQTKPCTLVLNALRLHQRVDSPPRPDGLGFPRRYKKSPALGGFWMR